MNFQTGNLIEDNQDSQNYLWSGGLAILLCLVLISLVVAAYNQNDKRLLNESAQLHIAAEENDNISAVLMLNESDWQSISRSNFDVSDKAHWFSFEIYPDKLSRAQLLEVAFANLDEVDLWFVAKASNQQKRVLKHYKTGDSLNFKLREIKHDQLIFPVPTRAQPTQIYLRVKSQGKLKVPIKIWAQEEYIQYLGASRLFIGIFYGFMAAMVLINLFLYITSRNLSTLLYAGYVTCLSMTLASSQGLAYRFIWPEIAAFQQHAVLFFVSTMLFFSSFFTASLLDIKQKYPKLARLFVLLRVLILFYILLIFIIPQGIIASSTAPVILIAMLFIFSSTLFVAFKGNPIARYLSVAWCSLLFSGFFGLADNFNWINLYIDLSYLLMLGAVIETLFMSLGIAMRFNAQRLLAKEAFRKAAENKQKAIQAKESLMQVQLEAKQKLEYAVDERNYELEIAIRELNEANNELERKSSIDPLTGVANRRAYDKKIIAEARRSRREKTPLAIAMLDIDHFKGVNDAYGHQCGDEALKHFAKVLKDCLKRPSDVICRYGGEEFVVILPNTDLEGARMLMESVRLNTENSQVRCEDTSIEFTVSIGVSTKIIATDSEYELLHAFADKLLYQAKENGRNQVKAAEF